MSLSPYRPCPTLLFLAVALGLSDAAHAAPQATTLDAVNVTAASEAEHARATLKRVPGASNVVDLTKADGRLSTSADVLAYQPGISAQSPATKAPRCPSVARASTGARARMRRALRCRWMGCR